MYYDTLVLSGGSVKTIVTLGAIQYCYDQKLINTDLKTYAGTSAGAILCYLLIIGYTPTEILFYFISKKLFKDRHYINIANLFSGEGVISFLEIHDHLERMTIDKVGTLLTFKDIETRFQKNLVVATYNFTSKKVEYLSADTTPTLPCLCGLRMSCSLPFIFSMYEYKSNYYIDGGIVDNFPIEIVEKDDNRILGFHINPFKDVNLVKQNDGTNFLETIYSLLSIPLVELEKYKMKNSKAEIVSLDGADFNLLNFDMPPKEKMDMFSYGYQIAQKHFDSTD